MEIKKPFIGEFPITADFGNAPDWYVKITGYPHNGLDFGMGIGTPVFACDDGNIQYADNVADADGEGINIRHIWGMSQYWHLSKLLVSYGQEVKKGDTIGYSGSTGWSTGPHLHFGIKVTEDPAPGMRGWTDPKKYFVSPLPPINPPAIVPRSYLVMIGDSLWSIAERFYGKGYYWTKIYEANKDKIKNPSIITPFQRLVIP